jgi:tetratricopeptide (TPR) repeat protein
MGAFFGSIHVRTENKEQVLTALREIARQCDWKFLVGPAINGWISVFHNEDQDSRVSTEIAKLLPHDLFQLMVHDDDIFAYWFYRDRRLVDRYNSCPDYFEGVANTVVSDEEKRESRGRPELFQDLLKDAAGLNRLKTLLAASREKYLFENRRMAGFVELLGLSNALSSYDYLQDGERDEIEGWEQFIHIEFRPESAEDYNRRGEAKLARNDFDGALADFKKALELNPDLAAAQANRDLAEKARHDRDHGGAELWHKYGTIKKAEGDLDAALRGFDMAIGQNPEFAEAYNNRGSVRKARGDLAGAMADFNRAIELKPGFAAAYNNRGLEKKANSDLAGAMADYDKAIELKPSLAAAYQNRGDLKHIKGDLDGALADFSKAIELKPDGASAHGKRGRVKMAKKDLDGALADFNRAIELKPDLAALYVNRGQLKWGQKDADGALADLSRAIELKPDLVEAYNSRAVVKRAGNDLDGALADLNRAIELKPDFEAGYAHRGEMRRIKGDLDGALADFDKALELKPDWTKVREKRDAIRKDKG